SYHRNTCRQNFCQHGEIPASTRFQRIARQRVPAPPSKFAMKGNRPAPAVFQSLILERNLNMGTILIIVLLLLLLGAWPAWPYSRSWGYYPSSTLGLVLVIVLVLALVGRI